ncbi:hypothetical protein SRABI91_05431 [Rhodococcoides fascians]|nr:hypothetical protein SRABI91_05431 [Rhodococcus fascians]
MTGRDDRIEIPTLGSDVRIDQRVLVLLLQRQPQRIDVLTVLRRLEQLLAVDEPDRTRGPHHRDLRRRPRQIHIRTHVLGPHHVVRPAIRLAGDDGDLPDRRLPVGIQQLRAPPDDAVVFLARPGQEPRHIDQRDDRNVETITGADEPGCFLRGIDIEGAGELGGLIGHDPHRPAVDPPEPDDDVAGPPLLNFEEFVVVEDPADHLVHVVRSVRRIRNQSVEFEILRRQRILDGSENRIRRGRPRGIGPIVRREVGQEVADVVEGVLLPGRDVVRDPGLLHVGVRATEFFHRHVLPGDGLDDIGAGDEHLTGAIDHDHEIGQGG